MPEQDDFMQIEGDEHIMQVFGESRNLIPEVRLVGFPMPSHIQGDNPVAAVQTLELILELFGGLGPARDHDQWFSRARFQVMQPDAVTGRNVTYSSRNL